MKRTRTPRIHVMDTWKYIRNFFLYPIAIFLIILTALFIWAATPTHYPGVTLKSKVYLRYNLNPNSEASTLVDPHMGCKFMDLDIYYVGQDTSLPYRFVSCDNRVGYVEESMLNFFR